MKTLKYFSFSNGWTMGICWNQKGERTLEIVLPMRYHSYIPLCGVSLYFITIGFWKHKQ